MDKIDTFTVMSSKCGVNFFIPPSRDAESCVYSSCAYELWRLTIHRVFIKHFIVTKQICCIIANSIVGGVNVFNVRDLFHLWSFCLMVFGDGRFNHSLKPALCSLVRDGVHQGQVFGYTYLTQFIDFFVDKDF